MVERQQSKASSGKLARSAIRDLLQSAGIWEGGPVAMKTWEKLATKVSQISGRSQDWSWRYLQSVWSGTVEPSEKLTRALVSLAVLESDEGWRAAFEPATVVAPGDARIHGALVMTSAVICSEPGCSVEFVPNVPWRTRCYLCSPIGG